jgi:pimeloyl-ACP methyl ester carboxylesterase
MFLRSSLSMSTPGSGSLALERTGARSHRQRAWINAAALLLFLSAGRCAAGPETVHYTSSDGFSITADYYRPSKPSALGVLVLPGAKEGRQAWQAAADSLARRGLHVLVPDLRGTGESAIQRGLRRERARFVSGEVQAARLDAEAGLRYLRELPATTIHAAALVSSGDADLSSYGARHGIMDRIARVVISPISLDDRGEGTRNEDPLLVIVGTEDIVGIEASARLAAEDPKRECWLVDGAGRGVELLQIRLDLIPDLTGWIEGRIGSP